MPMPESGDKLTINRDHELFLAISYIFPHTFLTVGVHDKVSNRNTALFAVGQNFAERTCYSSNMFNTLISSVKSNLSEERFIYHDTQREISYKAFQISDTQYTQLRELVFPQLLLRNAYSRIAHAYIPQASGEGQECEFVYQPIKRFAEDTSEEQVKKELKFDSPYRSLKLSKNCRHGGISLFNETVSQSSSKYNDVVNINFLRELSYTTTIHAGEFSGNIFILPLPPCKDELEPNQYKLLSILYRRLEKIPKINPNADYTLSKFNAVKSLYLSLCASQTEPDCESLLSRINQWETQGHKTIIDTKRRFSIFQTTTTRDTINELKEILHNKKPGSF